MQAMKTFCLSLLRKRDKFFTVVSKMKKVSILMSFFATLNALSKLINGWIMKLEGFV